MSGEEVGREESRRSCEGERAFIQIGIDAVERGDVVPHEQVVALIDAMIERQRARCA